MERVSHEEFLMWQAYYQIEPFGELRSDFRAGQICATMARIVGDGKTEYDATDFIRTYDSVEEAKRKDSVDAMNESLHAGFGALRQQAEGARRVNI